jgi:hypothetical protein
MLITPGPLLIQPNDKLNAIWLKAPAHKGGPAIATVWHTKAPDEGPGNAVVMAFASEMYATVRALAAIKSTEEAAAAKKHAKALLARIEEAIPL